MTPHDDIQDRMDRLAQRQDQLERQQRETTTRVDALNRDVDRRIDSLRGEMDRQFRDGERRVRSLERSRDTTELLICFCMPLVAAVAVIIILVIAAVASREQRQDAGEPKQRSPSSIDAPVASSGGPLPPVLPLPGHLSDKLTAALATMAGGPREPDTFNPSTSEERPPIESHSYQVGRVTPQFAICFVTGPADPAW